MVSCGALLETMRDMRDPLGGFLARLTRRPSNGMERAVAAPAARHSAISSDGSSELTSCFIGNWTPEVQTGWRTGRLAPSTCYGCLPRRSARLRALEFDQPCGPSKSDAKAIAPFCPGSAQRSAGTLRTPSGHRAKRSVHRE